MSCRVTLLVSRFVWVASRWVALTPFSQSSPRLDELWSRLVSALASRNIGLESILERVLERFDSSRFESSRVVSRRVESCRIGSGRVGDALS